MEFIEWLQGSNIIGEEGEGRKGEGRGEILMFVICSRLAVWRKILKGTKVTLRNSESR